MIKEFVRDLLLGLLGEPKRQEQPPKPEPKEPEPKEPEPKEPEKPIGPPLLPKMPNGKSALRLFRERIVRRYNHVRMKRKNLPEKTFDELFQLPDWLPLNTWLTIQLRGRPVECLSELSVDHLIPLNWSKDADEMLILFSYKNTRLIDTGLNTRKGDYVDEENRLLCFHLLGRYPKSDRTPRKDEYELQREAEAGDRRAKLLLRAQGKSQRATMNGRSGMEKRKAQRKKQVKKKWR